MKYKIESKSNTSFTNTYSSDYTYYTNSIDSSWYYHPYKRWKPKKSDKDKNKDWSDWINPSTGENFIPREESPEKLMEKEYIKTTSDGQEVTLTLGEIYELHKMGYEVEEMTFEELKKALVVIRL